MATTRGLHSFLLTTLCWVLLLTCCPPLAGASRLPTAYKRALLELDSNKPQVIRAELMHRTHPDSPFSLLRGSGAGLTAAADQAHLARRRRRAGVELTTPVSSGFQSGEYWMTLYLGTPVQKFVVIIDTGSDLVWVQCQPCTRPYRCYPETDPFFNRSASKSYSAVPCNDNSACDPLLFDEASCYAERTCHISYGYADGSGIEGVLSTETLAFGNITEGVSGISNFLFGCMNNDTGDFGTADGLAGFSRGKNSLPSQLSKLTSSNVFSYCLVPQFPSTSLTSPLLFGASNSKGLRLVYTPILDDPDGFYRVNLTGISINGIAVRIPQAAFELNETTGDGGTIFDSGTTLLYFTEEIYKPVLERFQGLITYPRAPFDPFNSNLPCYIVSGVRQPEFPLLTLHFSGVDGVSTATDLPVSGKSLFIEGTDDGTVQCLAVSTLGVISLNIVGNVAQADHYIETDLVHQRIGWTSRDCSLPL